MQVYPARGLRLGAEVNPLNPPVGWVTAARLGRSGPDSGNHEPRRRSRLVKSIVSCWSGISGAWPGRTYGRSARAKPDFPTSEITFPCRSKKYVTCRFEWVRAWQFLTSQCFPTVFDLLTKTAPLCGSLPLNHTRKTIFFYRNSHLFRLHTHLNGNKCETPSQSKQAVINAKKNKF